MMRSEHEPHREELRTRAVRFRVLLASLAFAVAFVPAADAVLPRENPGLASVSRETHKVTVPNLTGMKTRAARHRLAVLGLRVTIRAVVSTKPAGTVVAQRPLARAVVARGTIVRLSVAAAGEVAVPDVLGDLKDRAEQRLRHAGLSPRVVYVESLRLVGTVVAQDPSGGSSVASGSPVTISISSGPGP